MRNNLYTFNRIKSSIALIALIILLLISIEPVHAGLIGCEAEDDISDFSSSSLPIVIGADIRADKKSQHLIAIRLLCGYPKPDGKWDQSRFKTEFSENTWNGASQDIEEVEGVCPDDYYVSFIGVEVIEAPVLPRLPGHPFQILANVK